MKKILVTGGAGFVGSNLCRRLLAEGHMVICLDNFYTSTGDNIKELHKHPNFRFINHDIQEDIDITMPLDEIYNLACPASPPHYQKDPLYTTMTSILGATKMASLALRKGAKLLQASTSEVYGDPSMSPQKESYNGNVNPIGIRSCYDEGKRVAESILMDSHRMFGTKIKIIRIFNTYGPYMDKDDGRVVSNFIMQALRNDDITIYGDGQQTRSFQYIDDLLDGMIAMMASPDDFIGPVNIGTDYEFTMLDLANLVLLKTDSKSITIQQPLPSDDPKQRRADYSLATEKLGWKPKVELSEGLDKTIEYFKTQL